MVLIDYDQVAEGAVGGETTITYGSGRNGSNPYWSGLNYVKDEGSILVLVTPVFFDCYYFVSQSLFTSGILSSSLIIRVQNGFVVFFIIIIRVRINFLAHYYYWVCPEYLRYYKMEAKSKRSIKLYNLIRFFSQNSFMTIKQLLFLVFI